ncbi:2Fe-2S iron-sulfur cluster-binding protein [Mycobacterium sp. 3519A]|uniref:2Fe-2S iron-sulfur cluster-binding protein n=1 Tax=Mycobacterium sp. 3519A TaxID=2057184 RepID=UPI000C796802|nr:2Fe-2S iron-sulfur cluster-binding protein [Mycobacterium sp. 3519A]
MPVVKVTDRQGDIHDLEPVEGTVLMVQLRKLKVGIVGLCGGNMACGTCHVFVGQGWADRLSEPDEFEEELLAELDNRQPNSRLACQISYHAGLDGLEVTVATHY